MNKNKPILITGCHRSGTTWIGKTIAYSNNIIYIGEPFNPNLSKRGGICGFKFKNWFEYISEENQDQYYTPILKMINLDYDWKSLRQTENSLRDWKIHFKLHIVNVW